MDVFLELCKLSQKDQWCDTLKCNTCDAIHFKEAFLQVVDDIYPYSKKWKIEESKTVKSLNFDGQIKLAKIVSQTNLIDVDKSIEEPSKWINALTLVLYHIRNNKEAREILSRSLIIQFRQLIGNNDFCKEGILKRYHLEYLEMALMQKISEKLALDGR